MLLLCGAGNVRAQRQTVGRSSFEGGALFCGLTDKSFGIAGGCINWNKYYYTGYLSVGLEVAKVPHRYVTVEEAVYLPSGELLYEEEEVVNRFDALDALIGGGYHFRLLAPRSRVFILSAGLNAYAGVRHSKDVAAYTSVNKKGTEKANPDTNFALIFTPEVKAELFPFKNMSVFVSFRPKVNALILLKGKHDLVNVYMGCGLKYYL